MSRNPTRTRTAFTAVTGLALGALVLGMPAGAGAQSPSTGAESYGVDDGTHITLWTRAATQARAQALVDAYNASHKNQVDLTIIPTNDYAPKVGAAAATAGGLPDLISGDVVFMPNWTSAGLFQDITDRIATLSYADKIAQAPIDVSTFDGKKYGMPFVTDVSVWMYNKELFRQAGLDPEKPPTTLAEFAADAQAVAKLGNGVSGTFFGGNCGGCEVFTWFPIAYADGQPVMNPDGTQALLNSDEWKSIYQVFRGLVEDGSALMPDSQTETGPTWTGYFPKGKIGIMPMPASLQGMANDALKDEDIGVTSIKGVNGGESTLVGGDAIGISRDSKVSDQAWNFVSWLMSDDAQINVVAKGGNVVSRPDLANNQYTAADPRLAIMNGISAKGQTPYALNFQQAFNDPQSPWIALMQDVIFGDASKLDADNDAVTAALQP